MPAEGDEMHAPPSEIPDIAADVLIRLRERSPRVHCITNSVAQAFTANMLLAAGAVPSMTISPSEIAQFVGGANALLVNLGTLDAERREAIDIAVKEATNDGVPWVLDPVFIDRAPARADYAQALMARRPRAVRLNRAEFETLADDESDDEAVARHALAQLTVIGLSGETDCVTDGTRRAVIANGDALMARVTAMGCAASALVAGCLAVEDDAFLATTAGLIAIGVAGELAASRASGPGTFAAAIIDALYGLDRETIKARARVA
jgi:hydroxyethylthiazole kinase